MVEAFCCKDDAEDFLVITRCVSASPGNVRYIQTRRCVIYQSYVIIEDGGIYRFLP